MNSRMMFAEVVDVALFSHSLIEMLEALVEAEDMLKEDMDELC